MARTSTKPASIEQKALAASSKSEGMRMLYEEGYTVAQVTKAFGVGYPFAYGVAQRGGFLDTARTPRSEIVAKPKATAKAANKAGETKEVKPTRVAKAVKAAASTKDDGLTPGQRAYRARKARTAETAVGKGTTGGKLAAAVVKAAPTRKPGRPTPNRRQANRKSRTAA